MSDEFIKITEDELKNITGGVHGKRGLYEGPWKTVSGLETGYLALRSEPAYDDSNIIGRLYNGNNVQVIGNDAYTGNSYDPYYTWVYAPVLNKSGWVNSRFLV